VKKSNKNLFLGRLGQKFLGQRRWAKCNWWFF